MKKINVFLVAILAFSMFAISAQAQLKIGDTAENFTLSDINGKDQSLNGLKGTNGTIVVFLSAQCPIVKAYNERLNKVYTDYSGRGISFIGLNPNATESLEFVKTHAEANYKFPMLIDKGNVIADRFNAYATPQIFLFDKDNKLVYNGAIDNDKFGENITMTYLRDALDSHLAGKTIAKNTTNAIGCTIKKVAKKEGNEVKKN